MKIIRDDATIEFHYFKCSILYQAFPHTFFILPCVSPLHSNAAIHCHKASRYQYGRSRPIPRRGRRDTLFLPASLLPQLSQPTARRRHCLIIPPPRVTAVALDNAVDGCGGTVIVVIVLDGHYLPHDVMKVNCWIVLHFNYPLVYWRFLPNVSILCLYRVLQKVYPKISKCSWFAVIWYVLHALLTYSYCKPYLVLFPPVNRHNKY